MGVTDYIYRMSLIACSSRGASTFLRSIVGGAAQVRPGLLDDQKCWWVIVVVKMGTVHGVYLKYVGISALSYAGYAFLASKSDGTRATAAELLMGARSADRSLVTSMGALVLGYSTLLNGLIAVLFKLECGMGLIGKNRKTGQIPWWSYVAFFPFHIPTILYTHIHTLTGTQKNDKGEKELVPVASKVQPGWWIGGCYGHLLEKDWAGIIDLTVEFPEKCIGRTKHYLSTPTWDGVPASPAQLEEAAAFALSIREAIPEGDILVHCAHGRGRSTTIMCACLVKAGLYKTWEEAFEQGIRPYRQCCKLNRRMRQNLTAWQAEYVDGVQSKKGQ